MKTFHVIIVAAVACLAGGIGGFLLERLHAAKAARTMEGSCLVESMGTDMAALRYFQSGDTNNAIDYLKAGLEGSAVGMCAVIDENPQTKEAIGYRSWVLSAAIYRAKYPRLHAVGSPWDRKVTAALAQTLGTDMPPTNRRSQPPLALAVPLSRFTPRVGGGSAGRRPHLRYATFTNRPSME